MGLETPLLFFRFDINFSLVPFKCVPQALFLTCSPHSPSPIFILYFISIPKKIFGKMVTMQLSPVL